MKERHADQGYRKFWSTMKEMTWKERVKYFAYYYGVYAVIAIFLLSISIDMLANALKEKPEQLLNGTAVNIHVKMDMQEKLIDDVFPVMGGTDPEKQEVTLVANTITWTDIHSSSYLNTKMQAGTYDYVLTDQEGLDKIAPMGTLTDMTLLLPAEKLEPWKERFAYGRVDNKDYPLAINITGTPLAKGCTYTGDYIYLAFTANIDRVHVVEPFFDYLIETGLLTTS